MSTCRHTFDFCSSWFNFFGGAGVNPQNVRQNARPRTDALHDNRFWPFNPALKRDQSGQEHSHIDKKKKVLSYTNRRCSNWKVLSSTEPHIFFFLFFFSLFFWKRRPSKGGFRCIPPATCRLSTRRSFDHHGKGNGNFFIKRVSKIKKVKLLCVSHLSEIDQNSSDCEIACDSVKCAYVEFMPT